MESPTAVWGVGPLPTTIPPGTQGVDAFGNRTVTNGGAVVVEGLAHGSDGAYRPDGLFWPQSSLTAQGPTVPYTAPAPGVTESTPIQAVSPAVLAVPEVPVTAAPATKATSVTITPTTDNGFLVKVEHGTEKVYNTFVHGIERALEYVKQHV